MIDRLKALSELGRKVLWLASWTIHNANHIRANEDGMKVLSPRAPAGRDNSERLR